MKYLSIPGSAIKAELQKINNFGTIVNLPGRGREPLLLKRAARKLFREFKINPRVVSIELFGIIMLK